MSDWRQVSGWPYEVSSDGRVRRSEPGGSSTYVGRELSCYGASNGYLRVQLTRNGDRWDVGVHRLVLLAFVGPCPPGHEPDHINGDRKDNRAENLRWLPKARNRAKLGEEHPQVRLTKNEVVRIRTEYNTQDVTYGDLADKYGVGETTIGDIIRGEKWKHVRGPTVAVEPRCKITKDDVREIRRRADDGEAYSHIAKDFPVNPEQVGRVAKRQHWRNVAEAVTEGEGDETCPRCGGPVKKTSAGLLECRDQTCLWTGPPETPTGRDDDGE